MSTFNGSFLGVRESSSATPEFIEEYAVQRANEKSVGAEVAQFFIVFNSKNQSFGLAFSDELKQSLGFDKSYYNLVGGLTDNIVSDLYPSDDLLPSETEQQLFLDNINASLNLISSNIQSEFKSSLDESIEDKLIEIDLSSQLLAITNATTYAKSQITQHLNLRLEEIILEENEKIAVLELKVESLEQEINGLKDSSSVSGLTEDEVLTLISDNTSSSNGELGLTIDDVNEAIRVQLDTFSLDMNDPAMV